MVGDGSIMAGNTRGGNDRLDGGAGNDTIHGDATATYEDFRGSAGAGLRDTARGGNDNLNGGVGNDALYGDAREITDHARGGKDTLDGGAGNDTLYGDASLMTEFTKGGNDRLKGGAGDDTFGFAGASGGSADGTSAATPSSISSRSRRRPDIAEGFNGVADIGDLQIDRRGSNTVITVADYGTIELKNVTATLTDGDFVFVV